MTSTFPAAADARSLPVSIDQIEQRIMRRQRLICARAMSCQQDFVNGMTSFPTLLSAGAVGFVLGLFPVHINLSPATASTHPQSHKFGIALMLALRLLTVARRSL